MGQSTSSGGIQETETLQHTNEQRESHFHFLIGKLENMPESARKLFSLGRQYLITGSSEGGTSDTSDFCDLFKIYQPRTRGESEIVEGEQKPPTASAQQGLLSVPVKRSAPLHHFQTYVQWKAAHDLTNFYSLCLPKRDTIYLRPIGEFPEFVHTFKVRSSPHLELGLFETIQAFLQVFFCGVEVLLLPPTQLSTDADSNTGIVVKSRTHPVTGASQLCLNDLYLFLQGQLPPNGLCILGVSWTDLYPLGHNFALGEASPQHKAAAISFGRFETKSFNPEQHSDITEIEASTIWKLLKSSSHEVCHLLGLQHCSFFCCCMNESASVAEAMEQPLFLCPVCLRKLQQTCHFDVLERYRLLHTFLSRFTDQLPGDAIRFRESVSWLHTCISYLES